MNIISRTIGIVTAIAASSAAALPIDNGKNTGAVVFSPKEYADHYNRKVGMQYDVITNVLSKYTSVSLGKMKKGKHTLTVRGREEGAMLTEICIVKGDAAPGTSSGITITAGNGKIAAPMKIVEMQGEQTLVGGKYDGNAVYEFTIDEDGDYSFWGKAYGANPQSDSFFIVIDDGQPFVWVIPISKAAKWVEMEDGSLDNYMPLSFWLT